jgi:putative hydrolase of the HAD superfamily
LYLVTDGDSSVQNSKIDALNIRDKFKKIYTTGSLGEEWKKPSLKAFNEIAELEDVAMSELVYVGDDPNKDFVKLNSIGAQTVRVMTGRFRDLRMPPHYEAQHQIASIADLEI